MRGLFPVAPLVIVLGALLVWPLAVLLGQSTVGAGGGISLSRYAEVATDPRYLQSLGLTAVLAMFSVLIALTLSVPAAWYLERDRGPSRHAVAVALTVPLSLPGIVIGFFVILVFGNTGVVPQATEATAGQPLLRIAYTFGGLVLAYVYFEIPRVVLVVRGVAASVDQDAVDAARTLGASTATIYRRVVLPALRPAIAQAAALGTATAFGAFGTAATLTRGPGVLPLEIAATFTDNFQPQRAATLSVLLAVLTTGLLVGLGRLGETRASR